MISQCSAVYSEYIVTNNCVQPYPNLLTLHVQYIKNQGVKNWLPFELICAVYLEYIVTIDFVRLCPFWVRTDTGAFQVMHPYSDSVCLAQPCRQKVVSICAYMCIILRVNRIHSLCPSIPQLTYFICSVVYIMNRPYMFRTPRTKPSKSGFHLSLYVQYTIKYIVTIHFVCPYPNLLTLYIQYTKILAVKKWLPFELICAVYLECIVTIHFVRPYPNLLTLYVQYTNNLADKMWLPFELICAYTQST